MTTKVHLPGPKPRVTENGRSQMKYHKRENNTQAGEPAQDDFIQESSASPHRNIGGETWVIEKVVSKISA